MTLKITSSVGPITLQIDKPIQRADGEVLAAAFDPLQILNLHAELLGQLVLGETHSASQFADSSADVGENTIGTTGHA